MGFDVGGRLLQLVQVADGTPLLELRLHLRGEGVEIVLGGGLVVQKVGQSLILHKKHLRA